MSLEFRAFIRFHGVRHPATLGSEVEAFLSWLANERKVSVSTHRQALLAALLFFYGKVLCTGSATAQEIGRPRPSRRLPVVRPRMKWFASIGFSGRRASFVRPASVWNGHADQ